jgi:MerR family transcriptional regulator, thiopeptide resistance regulator
MAERRWRIGELANAVGLTVRTLRYYDAVGLLHASGRTEAGHRLYRAADVRQLYQILALRQLGLTLQEIGAVLAGADTNLETVVCRHLERVERQMAGLRALQARLKLALLSLQQAEQPSTEDLIHAMDHMTMLERYLTPDQLLLLKEQRQHLGDEAMAGFGQQRANLFAQLETARQAGEDPESPRVQELRQQLVALHQQVLGNNAGVLRALQTMIETEGVEAASGGLVTTELQAYVRGVLVQFGE